MCAFFRMYPDAVTKNWRQHELLTRLVKSAQGIRCQVCHPRYVADELGVVYSIGYIEGKLTGYSAQ